MSLLCYYISCIVKQTSLVLDSCGHVCVFWRLMAQVRVGCRSGRDRAYIICKEYAIMKVVRDLAPLKCCIRYLVRR